MTELKELTQISQCPIDFISVANLVTAIVKVRNHNVNTGGKMVLC